MPKYLTDRKLKMSAILTLEIKEAKKHKMFNFLMGCFLVMRGPMDMIFGVFSDTSVRLRISKTSHFCQDITKVITI